MQEKSRLRLRIDEVLADGEPHSIDEIWSRACNGLVVLPGISARIVERERRYKTPDKERRRNVDRAPELVMWSGERHLVRVCLKSMVNRGTAKRTGPGVYQAIGGTIDGSPDSSVIEQ